MTSLRYSHSNPTPTLTAGTDGPEPVCSGNPGPFDILIDNNTYAKTKWAAVEAADMCGRCPLAVACLLNQEHQDWAPAVRHELGLREKRKATAA